MPKNLKLQPIPLPMELKFGQKANTDFKVIENNIKVELIDGPTIDNLLSWVPEFVNATWAEANKERTFSQEKRIDSVIKSFVGKTLPTVLENIRFTFLIEGITYIEVSHILRHRNFSISAYCSGDVHLHNAEVMIPESINNSSEFNERYRKIMTEAKELYADMVNSKEVSLMDARYALPVSRNQGYIISMCYKDILAFVKQRIDRAIQPKSDNIIAYQIWIEVCKQLPFLTMLDIVDFDMPSWFFINTARSGHSTNLYTPEEHNDKFDWHPEDFIYQAKRDEVCGTDRTPSEFPIILEEYKQELEKIKISFTKEDKNKQFVEIINKIKETL